jgi:hypothetical protein
MAGRSIATDSARRTRTSRSGLRGMGRPSLSVMKGLASAREWSRPRKISRSPVTSLIATRWSWRSRARSAVGTWSMNSTSPASRAGGAGAVIGDHAVGDARPVGLGAPIGVVALELDAVAQAVGGDAERARCPRHAVGVEILGGGTLMRFAVEDVDVGEVLRQQRVGDRSW